MTSNARGRSRTGTAVAAAVAASLLVATPASAGGYDSTDPAGDMTSYTVSDKTEGNTDTIVTSGPNPAPAQTNGDIVSFSVRHKPRLVVLRMGLRDLRTPTAGKSAAGTTTGALSLDYRIRTGKRVYEVAGYFDSSGKISWTVGPLMNRSQPCRGLRPVITADHTVTISVPRRCLGWPPRVRVAAHVGVETYSESTNASSSSYVTDEAHRAGGNDDMSRAFGPWVRRG